MAGLTVACMLIPQSISYATSLAKLSPTSGLVCYQPATVNIHIVDPVPQFSASIPGIVYALLGSSRQLNVAPEAALSLLVGQAISDILHKDPHTSPEDPAAVGIAVATAITVQVGLPPNTLLNSLMLPV